MACHKAHKVRFQLPVVRRTPRIRNVTAPCSIYYSNLLLKCNSRLCLMCFRRWAKTGGWINGCGRGWHRAGKTYPSLELFVILF